MPDVDISITAGAGTAVRAFQKASGDYDQYVRQAVATAVDPAVAWAATTAGTVSVLAADPNRVGLLMICNATGTVYLRFDATVPNVTLGSTPLYHWYLAPGDRYEVPLAFCQRPVSMVASTSGGFMYLLAGTCS